MCHVASFKISHVRVSLEFNLLMIYRDLQPLQTPDLRVRYKVHHFFTAFRRSLPLERALIFKLCAQISLPAILFRLPPLLFTVLRLPQLCHVFLACGCHDGFLFALRPMPRTWCYACGHGAVDCTLRVAGASPSVCKSAGTLQRSVHLHRRRARL